MGGTNSREEYPYGYARKEQWVVRHEDDDRECCMAVATSHFFRPAIGHDWRRSRHGNPQDAHDVNAWDAISEPGTPVAPLRSSYNGWHKGGASGARCIGGAGGMRGSSSCMGFGSGSPDGVEDRVSLDDDTATMGGRRHRSFSSLKKGSSYCEMGKTMESGLNGRRNVSFGTLSIARIDSRESLTKSEKKRMWYDRQDVGSFVVNELTRRKDIGVTSTSALCPEAADLNLETEEEADPANSEPQREVQPEDEEEPPMQMPPQVQPEPYQSEGLGQGDNEGLVVF
mmetsp:Transcript_4160/g.8915  ORF Transcript_4160/g.8915 Transcript_4160/m.8915 type:complete len:284 (+) Transcript_4160:88-939(+)